MSGGLGALIAGLGMGAAQSYYKKANADAENEFQDRRDQALASGGKIPMPSRSTRKKPPSAIEALTGKVKSLFSDKAAAPAAPGGGAVPVVSAAPAALSPIEPVAQAVPVEPVAQPVLTPVASALPEVDTEAFNDDTTVPNEPTQFKNVYA